METIVKINVYLNNLNKSQIDYFVQKFNNFNYDYELLDNGLYKLYFIHLSENEFKRVKSAIKNYKID